MEFNKKNQKGVSFGMRKNAYNSLDEFLSQYIGVWGPSDGHWFGLDFLHNGVEYRLNTGTMYGEKDITDDKGNVIQFGLYRKTNIKDPKHPDTYLYELLEEKESVSALLDSLVVGGIPFRVVIMADDTELLGQD